MFFSVLLQILLLKVEVKSFPEPGELTRMVLKPAIIGATAAESHAPPGCDASVSQLNFSTELPATHWQLNERGQQKMERMLTQCPTTKKLMMMMMYTCVAQSHHAVIACSVHSQNGEIMTREKKKKEVP